MFVKLKICCKTTNSQQILLMPSYNCDYCKRNYKEKFNYDRHITCCEFLFKTRRQQNNEYELSGPTPNLQEMYQLIQHMSLRIDKLEKENQRLQQVTRRKYNVLEQLNNPENINNMTITFSDWIKTYILPEVHNSLEHVYKNDLLEGLKDVLLRAIQKFDTNSIPIRTFDNSTSFYIFNLQTDGNKKWIKIIISDLDKYLRRISNQFLYDFKEYWYEPHSELIKTSEKYNEMYLEYHGKILGGKITEDTLFQKLRKHIFTNVKQSPKAIVEYVA